MKVEPINKIEKIDLEHRIKEKETHKTKKKGDGDFKKVFKKEIDNPNYFGKNLYWPLFGFYFPKKTK